MTLYSLIEKKGTGELHLFRSRKTLDSCHVKEKESICKKMEISEKGKVVFGCENEDSSRMECA